MTSSKIVYSDDMRAMESALITLDDIPGRLSAEEFEQVV